MGMEKWISRKEEYELPEFKSHDEARAYFKEKYGDNFQMMDSDYIDGKKIYFYKLIVNKKEWEKGIKEMQENGYTSGMGFAMAAQPIEIWEDGGIHIIH
jgi:hypothetical protein